MRTVAGLRLVRLRGMQHAILRRTLARKPRRRRLQDFCFFHDPLFMKNFALIFAVCFVAAVGNIQAQNRPPSAPTTEKKADEAPFDVREHYTKYEYRVPMRDGVRSSPPFTCRRTSPNRTRF